MAFRILSLLLCLLIAGPMSTPAWALARPETRVEKIFSDSPKSASADRDQTLDARRESRGCDYDFASGVCKYLYAHADPVNRKDPSGHLATGSSAETVSVSGIMGLMARQVLPTVVRLPGHIAARGFMKWAWLAGGIGAGVQTLMQDTQFGMEIQIQVKANPTASPNAYENYKCVEFATDAEEVFRRRGKQPQRIIYQSRPWRTWGDNIMAAPGFGFFGGENISISGHHEGVLVDGRVYDNNVPFGVPSSLSDLAWKFCVST